MKYLLTLFAALFIGLFSQLPAHATWAAVTANANAAASNVVTIGSVTGVTVGDLIVVSVVGTTATSSISDTHNTYTLVTSVSFDTGARYATIFYSVVTTGGALTITASGYGSFPVIGAAEYSFTPGNISVANTNTSSGNSLGLSTGPVTYTASTALIVGTFGQGTNATETFTPTSPFVTRASSAFQAGVSLGLYYVDLTNPASSGQTPAGNWTNAVTWGGIGVAFQSSGDNNSLTVNPTSVSIGSIGNTLTLTGTGTAWTSGTPGSPTFTASAGTITAQTVNSSTSATLTYSAPASAQTVTLTDPSTSDTTNLIIGSSGYHGMLFMGL
jgi:hypothetical protein